MKNLTWQNPEQLFVAQELINKVKSKCCGIKGIIRKTAMTNEIFSIIRNGLTEHYHLSISSTPINCDNELGQNLLQEAIAYYRNSIAVDLVNRGININHQDNRGLTPLHYCVQHNNLTIAELLLAKGGKVNILDSSGNNPLWYAVFYADGDYQFVKLLIKYGADALSKNKAMRSPLDFAKEIGDEVMTKILLK